MSFVVYCHCADYQLVSEQVKSRVLDAFIDTGTECKFVSDLCKMAVQEKTVLQDWMKNASDIKIIACYPRAIRWLFEYAGVTLPKETEFVNLRTDDIEKVISEPLNKKYNLKKNEKPIFKKAQDWIPWFPVIDYDRCKNCKQCMNFCLFGVYSLSEDGKVRVENPANCKTNCPACARMCPETAIIFPKYPNAPINGDEVTDQTMQNEKVAGDIKKLIGKDVYAAIRSRTKGAERFAKDRDRQQAMPDSGDLCEKLGIGPNVLKSLSADEMAKIKSAIYQKCQKECLNKPEDKKL